MEKLTLACPFIQPFCYWWYPILGLGVTTDVVSLEMEANMYSGSCGGDDEVEEQATLQGTSDKEFSLWVSAWSSSSSLAEWLTLLLELHYVLTTSSDQGTKSCGLWFPFYRNKYGIIVRKGRQVAGLGTQ